MHGELPRLMLAAPASGGGKTTLVTGLLRAFRDLGLRPAARKCGPDYLDPLFHREALGVPTGNLDLFLSSPDTVRALLARAAADAGIMVLEGVMGYYDGVGGTDRASSWHLAAETGTPTVLVVQPKGAFLSLAALLRGFTAFREDSMIRGVILNRCGETLYRRLAPVIESETVLRCYGWLPEMPELSLPSRHLGLTPPEALPGMGDRIALLADTVRRGLDLDGLVKLAGSAPAPGGVVLPPAPRPERPVRIAVARDRAFFFSYRENTDMLEALGARLVSFSPLEDEALPENIHGLLLEGGYPELYAARLSGNAAMRRSVREAVAGGMPTVAECGGFLYLHTSLAGPDGVEYPMVGVIPGRAADVGRLVRFGYATLHADEETLLLPAGASARVHEFHYWDSDAPGDSCTARKAGRTETWSCVHGSPSLHAGFPHMYFPGDGALAGRFVDACRRFRDGRASL